MSKKTVVMLAFFLLLLSSFSLMGYAAQGNWQFIAKLLVVSLIIFFELFIVALVVLWVRERKRRASASEIRKPLVKENKQYGWEKIFRYRPEEKPVSAIPKKAFLVISALIAAVFLVVLLSNFTFPKAGFSVNVSRPLVDVPEFSIGKTIQPAGENMSFSGAEFEPSPLSRPIGEVLQEKPSLFSFKQKASELFSRELFATYFPYALAGFLMLAIAIFLLLHFEKKK